MFWIKIKAMALESINVQGKAIMHMQVGIGTSLSLQCGSLYNADVHHRNHLLNSSSYKCGVRLALCAFQKTVQRATFSMEDTLKYVCKAVVNSSGLLPVFSTVTSWYKLPMPMCTCTIQRGHCSLFSAILSFSCTKDCTKKELPSKGSQVHSESALRHEVRSIEILEILKLQDCQRNPIAMPENERFKTQEDFAEGLESLYGPFHV